MKNKRTRSAGVRNPVRNAVLFGLLGIAGIALVGLGMTDRQESGRSGSPLLMLGLFPALLGPIVFAHYAGKIRVFRGMRSGRTAIARWTVTAAELSRFYEVEERVPAGSIDVNFYRPPKVLPAGGMEVIFSDSGVLIGDGYFPLSVKRGRCVQSVRYLASDSPSIEFAMVIKTAARTSSVTVASYRTSQSLRVPVSADAGRQVGDVVRRYEAAISKYGR